MTISDQFFLLLDNFIFTDNFTDDFIYGISSKYLLDIS